MRVLLTSLTVASVLVLLPSSPANAQAIPPTIQATLNQDTIPLNGTVGYCVNLGNPNTGTALTGVSMTVPMPSGLIITTSPIGPPPANYPLCGGTFSITSTLVTFSMINIGTNSSCGGCMTLQGILPGLQTVTTSTATSNQGENTVPVSDSVMVIGSPAQPDPVAPIPTLDPKMLALLMAVVSLAAIRILRR